LEVNPEKTKYMLMSRKKAEQKHDIQIANGSFERVEKFRYLGTTLNRSKLHAGRDYERLNSGNACYHSVQSLLSTACCIGT
jgi:hypothetical protein